MKNDTAQHLSEVVAFIVRETPATPPHETARLIHTIHKLGCALHRRYEAACSYEWANTERYEKATERLEAKLLTLADSSGFNVTQGYALDVLPVNGPKGCIWIALQRDPRGWPVMLRIAGRDVRLGGDA